MHAVRHWRDCSTSLPELPTSFTYNFIPGALYDFVPAESETAAATLVTDLLDVQRQNSEVSRSISRAVNPERDELIRRRAALGREQSRLRTDFQTVRAGMRFLSQYDVLQGERLIDPPALRDMPLTEIDRQFRSTK